MVPVPPFAIVRVPVIVESVEDAIHAGAPFWSVRMRPSVDEARVVRFVDEFAKRMSPEVYEDLPVPPFAAESAVFKVRLPTLSMVKRVVVAKDAEEEAIEKRTGPA